MNKVLFQDSLELIEFVGKEVAVSDWLEIKQSMIQTFADCTNDHQWIHIDEERAKKESIYGSTIAHGFLTLSLIPYFLESCISYPFAKRSINYGLNKVRFPSAVTVNSKLRGRFFIQEITSIDGGIQIEWNIIIEIDGMEKPACVADVLFRLYF